MNKVQHFEIPADDISRAQKFYNSVFDWKTEEYSMGKDTYHLFNSGIAKDKDVEGKTSEPGAIDGAAIKRENEKGVIIYITVNSIDDTIKKTKSAGGKLVREKSTFEVGSYARVSDSEGNVVGLFEMAK
jgi:predicted enzyme related to lactoylglutathione lyase